MIFNQFSFVFVFLPVVLCLFYFYGSRRLRIPILILASFVFYGISGLVHLSVLVLDILVIYFLTYRNERIGKVALTFSILLPISFLIYFKYSSFLLSDVIGIIPAVDERSFSLFQDVLLPAGISFFTFQTISYAIDRYRGEVQAPPFLDFVFYISFFPQLVAGPIVRFNQMGPQIRRISEFSPDANAILFGLTYFVAGLTYKVLIADSLGNLIDPMTARLAELSALDAYFVLFSYSFQIYFDFYGYSLIAIGLGVWFGIRLPANFRRPYEAASPKDFWRRWHVSLSYWIRDYLYLPLGGNEKYARNIVIIFLACGLWHGAGWNFVAWGAFHAALVLLAHRFEKQWGSLPLLMQRALTFLLVSFGWILFLFDFADAGLFLTRLVDFAGPGSELNWLGWLVLAIAAFVCFRFHVEDWADKAHVIARLKLVGVCYGALLFICIIMFDRSDSFIYFRF